MENNKPEKNFRLGAVRVSIWKDIRKGPNGREFEARTVTIDRAYKDAGGEWKNTHSLKEADVPKAVAALNKAYLFMLEKEPDTEE